MKKPFPVPEAKIDGRCTRYILKHNTVKYIFIDRSAAAEGKPCWMIYLPVHKVVYRATCWLILDDTNVTVEGRGHKDTPLLPDGPAFWVETYAAVEVIV